MARSTPPFYSFSGGEMGREVHSRATLEQYPTMARLLENMIPEVSGSLMFRPGLKMRVDLLQDSFLTEFVYDTSRYALIFQENVLRFEQLGGIIARASVSTAITHGDFNLTPVEHVALATLTASSTGLGAIANVADDDSATFWASSGTGDAYIDMDLGTAQTIYDLWLTSDDSDADDTPHTFTLSGSATGAFAGEETTVLTITGDDNWATTERRKYAVTTPGSYRYYRLNMTDSEAGVGTYRLATVEMYDEEWLDISDVGGNVNFNGGVTGLELESNGVSVSGVTQKVSIDVADDEVEHALRVVVDRGPVEILIGTTAGGNELFSDSDIRKGVHSLAFTPGTGVTAVYITIKSSDIRRQIVTSIAVESAGDLTLPTPYSVDDMKRMLHTKEVDVMWLFYNDRSIPWRRLERRGSTSWSLVYVDIEDGPFKATNLDQGHTMAVNGRVGNVTLTSNKDYFESGMEEKLIRLNHGGQFVQASVAAEGTFTPTVEVTGIGTAREIEYRIEGTFTATVTLQRSVGNELSFIDVASYNSPGAYTYNDGNDNELTFYRIGIKTGDYTSGTADLEIEYNSGQSSGVVKILSITDKKNAECEVVEDVTKTDATNDWEPGEWSAFDGYPDVGMLSDGRLWTMREEFLWGSKSATFESHETSDDDESAIARSLGVGDVQTGRALIDLIRLVALCSNGEPEIRSSSFDEVLTASNINIKGMSNVGSARIRPVKVDSRGLFVERSGRRLYETVYDVQSQRYVPRSLMLMHKQIGRSGIRQMAMARQPDTRIFVVLENGECAVKIYDPAENVFGWCRLTTPGASGLFKSVIVLPQEGEDRVLFVVQRTIGGATKYYLEELDELYFESRTAANCLDSYVRTEGSSMTTISGLDHLEGETVQVWADGSRQADQVVSSGQITLEVAADSVCVGLGYTGKYRSPKLPFGAQTGSAMGQRSRATSIVFTVRDSAMGIKFGSTFDKMDQLGDNILTDDKETYNGLFAGVTQPKVIPGNMQRDPAICIQCDSPAPNTIDGYTIIGLDLDERTG